MHYTKTIDGNTGHYFKGQETIVANIYKGSGVPFGCHLKFRTCVVNMVKIKSKDGSVSEAMQSTVYWSGTS